MSTPVLRRIAAGLAIPAALALGLVACGDDDATREDLVDELVEGGAPEDQANCVADRVYGELDQDEINDLAESDSPEEAGEAGQVLTDAITECVTAG